MRLLTYLLPIALLGLTPQKATVVKQINIAVTEPSDVCVSSDGSGLWIAGNTGELVKTDLLGRILRKLPANGSDYEAITAVGKYLYVIDETFRRLDVIDTTDMSLANGLVVQDFGARNASFEGLAYNPVSKHLLAFTEKPVRLTEFDLALQKVREIALPQFKELSAATYHNGNLWLLSDEQRLIYQVNADNFSILNTWRVNILNPEGLCFDTNGQLYIVSDDRRQLYHVKL